jgi:hypothetical protein
MITRRMLVLSSSAIALARSALAAPPLREGQLFKNPQCNCCEGYADYLRQNGYTITVTPTNDLAEIDRKAGIPEPLEGCHTMFIGGYFVGGHVPFEALSKLLGENPGIKGITLPGMPAGSPGMFGEKQEPFTIYAIAKDGTSSVYMKI